MTDNPELEIDYPAPIYLSISEYSPDVIEVDNGGVIEVADLSYTTESLMAQGVSTVDILEIGGITVNTGGGGGVGLISLITERFVVGSTGQAVFTLSGMPQSGSVTMVFLNGLIQGDDLFSVTGNTLTFTSGSGITAGDTLSVYYT